MVMVAEQTLLELLSDGHFHSGTELGEKLGISRTAVWKQIKDLEKNYGLDVQAVQGRGYRFSRPVELLDKQSILDGLAESAKVLLAELKITTVLDSTNHVLMQQDLAQYGRGRVLLAEMQTAGRGRRGKTWVSPFAQNIYLSILWGFDNAAPNLSAVSLAVGVAVVKALTNMGIEGLKLKWPNDIYFQGKKLGGILLELKGEAGGPCAIVVGLGLNVSMSRQAAEEIDQAWIDLSSIRRQRPSRNRLVSELLSELLPAMKLYSQQGFKPFIAPWQQRDMLKNEPVILLLPQQQRTGIARGINEEGALMFESEGNIEPVYSGEVSLRMK